MLDIEKYKTKKVTLKADSNGKDEMSYYELARWMCLVEAVDCIDKKCQQLDVSDKSNIWVKPIAIQKYVDERTEGMLFELTNQGKV